MLATILEEMPPFPERESSILAKLKKKKPAAAKVIDSPETEKRTPKPTPSAKMNSDPPPAPVVSSADLLVDVFGSLNEPAAPQQPTTNHANQLVDGKFFTVNFSSFCLNTRFQPKHFQNFI